MTVPREYRPWGHAPRDPPAAVVPITWRSEPPTLAQLPGSVLPFGYGRSYGDSCLNPGGALLDVAPLCIKRSLGVISRPGAYLPPVAARLMHALRKVTPRSIE